MDMSHVNGGDDFLDMFDKEMDDDDIFGSEDKLGNELVAENKTLEDYFNQEMDDDDFDEFDIAEVKKEEPVVVVNEMATMDVADALDSDDDVIEVKPEVVTEEAEPEVELNDNITEELVESVIASNSDMYEVQEEEIVQQETAVAEIGGDSQLVDSNSNIVYTDTNVKKTRYGVRTISEQDKLLANINKTITEVSNAFKEYKIAVQQVGKSLTSSQMTEYEEKIREEVFSILPSYVNPQRYSAVMRELSDCGIVATTTESLKDGKVTFSQATEFMKNAGIEGASIPTNAVAMVRSLNEIRVVFAKVNADRAVSRDKTDRLLTFIEDTFLKGNIGQVTKGECAIVDVVYIGDTEDYICGKCGEYNTATHPFFSVYRFSGKRLPLPMFNVCSKCDSMNMLSNIEIKALEKHVVKVGNFAVDYTDRDFITYASYHLPAHDLVELLPATYCIGSISEGSVEKIENKEVHVDLNWEELVKKYREQCKDYKLMRSVKKLSGSSRNNSLQMSAKTLNFNNPTKLARDASNEELSERLVAKGIGVDKLTAVVAVINKLKAIALKQVRLEQVPVKTLNSWVSIVSTVYNLGTSPVSLDGISYESNAQAIIEDMVIQLDNLRSEVQVQNIDRNIVETLAKSVCYFYNIPYAVEKSYALDSIVRYLTSIGIYDLLVGSEAKDLELMNSYKEYWNKTMDKAELVEVALQICYRLNINPPKMVVNGVMVDEVDSMLDNVYTLLDKECKKLDTLIERQKSIMNSLESTMYAHSFLPIYRIQLPSRDLLFDNQRLYNWASLLADMMILNSKVEQLEKDSPHNKIEEDKNRKDTSFSLAVKKLTDVSFPRDKFREKVVGLMNKFIPTGVGVEASEVFLLSYTAFIGELSFIEQLVNLLIKGDDYKLHQFIDKIRKDMTNERKDFTFMRCPSFKPLADSLKACFRINESIRNEYDGKSQVEFIYQDLPSIPTLKQEKLLLKLYHKHGTTYHFINGETIDEYIERISSGDITTLYKPIKYSSISDLLKSQLPILSGFRALYEYSMTYVKDFTKFMLFKDISYAMLYLPVDGFKSMFNISDTLIVKALEEPDFKPNKRQSEEQIVRELLKDVITPSSELNETLHNSSGGLLGLVGSIQENKDSYEMALSVLPKDIRELISSNMQVD